MTALIAGRVLQGMGAALGPLAIGLARDRASKEQAPVWIALLVAAAGTGAAVGLLLGGVLVDAFSVAAVFWFLLAVAVGLFLAILVFVPETPVRESVRPDWAGGLLLATALLAALLAVSQGNTWGWGSARVVTLVAVSAIVFAGFVVVERAVSAPLVDMRLMARRPVWSANLVAFAMGFALFIAGVVVPQIAQASRRLRVRTRLDVRRDRPRSPAGRARDHGRWLGERRAGTQGRSAEPGRRRRCRGRRRVRLARARPRIRCLGRRSQRAAGVRHRTRVRRTHESGRALGQRAAHGRLRGDDPRLPHYRGRARRSGRRRDNHRRRRRGARLPGRSGFTGAFVLGLVAALVALGATVAIPGRAAIRSSGTHRSTGTVAPS